MKTNHPNFYRLRFRWGVSRGRKTSGYTICTLFVDDKKVSSANGGGYDLSGTVFGDWVEKAFKAELLKLKIPMSRRNGQRFREYYGLTYQTEEGGSSYTPKKGYIKPLIDGGCGFSAVEKILKACGWHLIWVSKTTALCQPIKY